MSVRSEPSPFPAVEVLGPRPGGLVAATTAVRARRARHRTVIGSGVAAALVATVAAASLFGGGAEVGVRTTDVAGDPSSEEGGPGGRAPAVERAGGGSGGAVVSEVERGEPPPAPGTEGPSSVTVPVGGGRSDEGAGDGVGGGPEGVDDAGGPSSPAETGVPGTGPETGGGTSASRKSEVGKGLGVAGTDCPGEEPTVGPPDVRTGDDGWCLAAGLGRRDPATSTIPDDYTWSFGLSIVRDDDSTPRTLRYPTAQEVDFAVLDEAGTERWRWSVGQSFGEEPHTVVFNNGRTEFWTIGWDEDDEVGRALPAGRYTLVVTTLADELADLQPAPVPFEVP